MGTSVSRACTAHVRTIIAALAAFVLTLGLAPLVGFAQEPVAGGFTPPEYESDARSASADPGLPSAAEGPTLASVLAGSTASIVSADVALDASDPIVGSFTVDGLTYAVNNSGATLVSVAGPLAGPEGEGSAEGGFTNISIPATVTYNDATYDVVAVGPYAFYLSGATDVTLPDSIASVDCRAFRSSDVERVEVDPGNPNIASYEGALYSADESRLLLIPEGRAGSVPIPSEAEVVEPSVFSHCSLVDAISVDGGGAAFLSWDGLLYDASGTTLLRVPAGATEITMRDGCTAIAAGAMEGCAKLERINAPASVTPISPDVFESIPTVSLPIASALQDDSQDESVAGPLAGPGYEGDARSASADSSAEAFGSAATQLTAMVALSTVDDDLPEVDPSSIEVALPEDADAGSWEALGLVIVEARVQALGLSVSSADSHAASPGFIDVNVYPNHRTLKCELWVFDVTYDKWFAKLSEGNITDSVPFAWNGNPSIATGWDAWQEGHLGRLGGGYVYFGQSGYLSYPPSLYYQFCSITGATVGYTLVGFNSDPNATTGIAGNDTVKSYSIDLYAIWRANTYSVAFDLNGASGTAPSSMAATYDQDATLPEASRTGYKFLGWNTAADGSGTGYQPGTVRNLTAADKATVTLYAQWERMDFDISFDTDSEPGDADYPGEAKPDETISKDSGAVSIEDPKRPGYVFEGWVIPNTGGTEAVDQDLVYQGDDGKWYVDASKLPDYAGDDGRVELTARWTSVISVDVPSSVTFYADLVTQGQESREGAASSAFGQSKVANQSQVDLRVVGLESSAVKTTDSTLGADSVLKKADAATPSSSTQKLLSLYPSTKQWTADELQDPDAVGGDKAASAVDFDLDDVLLERSFKADDFTIAAGDTLNLGYRLNLTETGQELDYDRLSTLEDGQFASIANVSYTFAAEGHVCGVATGSKDDPLWIEYEGSVYGLRDIKASAECISRHGSASPCYPLYKKLLDAQVTSNGKPGAGPYFQLKVDGRYLPLQLIGICQDTKSDGSGKAGLTLQMRDVYAINNTRSTAAGGGVFNTSMNPTATNSGGWLGSAMRERLSGKKADGSASTMSPTFWSYLPAEVQNVIVGVDKYHQLTSTQTDSSTGATLQKTTNEKVWPPSMYEVYGRAFSSYNNSEALTNVAGYVPFQYMAYQGNGSSSYNTRAIKAYNNSVSHWWERSAYQSRTSGFVYVNTNGTCNYNGSASITSVGIAPAFCL